jgi:FlaA1/EpsC-like NDP-sugar epimerase
MNEKYLDAQSNTPIDISKQFLRSFRTRLVDDLYRVILRTRFWFLVLGHSLIFFTSLFVAFFLRFDLQWPEAASEKFFACVTVVIIVKLLCFYALRSFHGWWRYVTFSDLSALAKATAASALTLIIVDYFAKGILIPRSVLVIDSAISILALGVVRSSWRMFDEEIAPLVSATPHVRTLLIGTSDAVVRLGSQIKSNSNLDYRIIGLVRVDENDNRPWISNLPVLGSIADLTRLIRTQVIQEILVPAGEVSGPQLRDIIAQAEAAKKRIHVLPQINDQFRGNGKLPIRDVDINDLLRREPVVLNTTAIGELLRGKRVLVTGAGGSIGSEICRQVLKFLPSELILVGRGENRIFAIDRELQRVDSATRIIPLIADVTEKVRMQHIFETYRPEIVFHAAAHKHVPLMEQNVGEAVKNNLVGTKTVADLADEYCCKSFVLISTDKAVNPTSIMGATKQLAERYVNEISRHSATNFITVRFGNVLGSAGSVVPIFREQIERGGPITITDKRMRRYFMTIPEASRLVLQAAAMGSCGEIFVLDMGEPVEIVSLAKDMIRLSGLPESAIDIEFTGTRPGEKLYEELYFSEEESIATDHPKLRCAKHREQTQHAASDAIELLIAEREFPERQREILHKYIPEFCSTTNAESGEGNANQSQEVHS